MFRMDKHILCRMDKHILCRMDKHIHSPQTGMMRWVLIMLVVIMAGHFLLEDSRLLSVSLPVNSAASQESFSYDQIDHQDDLAYPASVPARMSNPPADPTFAWAGPFVYQTSFPILIPPKI